MTEGNTPRSAPPERVPTLTEVLAPGLARGGSGTASFEATTLGALPALGSSAAASGTRYEDEVLQRLQAKVLTQVEMALTQRLAAALEPVLQQALAQLVAQVVATTRAELASSLREQVSLAMAQENSGHRSDSVPR